MSSSTAQQACSETRGAGQFRYAEPCSTTLNEQPRLGWPIAISKSQMSEQISTADLQQNSAIGRMREAVMFLTVLVSQPNCGEYYHPRYSAAETPSDAPARVLELLRTRNGACAVPGPPSTTTSQSLQLRHESFKCARGTTRRKILKYDMLAL